MFDVLELLVKVRTEGLSSLDQFESTVKKTGAAAGQATQDFGAFQSLLKRLTETGYTTREALDLVAKSGGTAFGSWAKELLAADKEFQTFAKNAEKFAQVQAQQAERAARAAQQEAERSEKAAARDVAAADRKAAAEERATERIVRALERRASVYAQTSRVEQLIQEKSFVLSGITNPVAAQRSAAAYDTLIQGAQQRAATQSAARIAREGEREAAAAESAAASRISALERLGTLGASYAGGIPTFLGRGAFSAGLAVPLVSAAAVYGGMSMLHSEAQGARATVDSSERLGMSVQETRDLQNEAKLAGVNFNVLESSVRTLSSALEDSSGPGKRAFEGIQKLGISTITSSGDVREMGPVLLEVIDRLSEMPDKTLRAAEAEAILGRSAKEILPLIEKHRELRDELAALGLSSDENLVKKMSEVETKFAAVGIAYDNLKLRLLEPLTIPAGGLLELLTHMMAPGPPPGPRAAIDLEGNDLSKPTRGMGVYDPRSGLPLGEHFDTGLGIHVASNNTLDTGLGIHVVDDNRTTFSKFVGSQGDQEDVLRKRVDAARTEYENEVGKSKQFTGVGVNDAARDTERAKVNDLYVAYEKLNGELKALQEHKRGLNELDSFTDRMGKKDTNPIDQIFADRDTLIRRGRLTPAEAGRATDAANEAITRELEKQQNELNKENARLYIEPKRNRDPKKFDDTQLQTLALIIGIAPEQSDPESLRKGLVRAERDTVNRFKKGIDTDRQVSGIQLEENRSRIEDQSKRTLRNLELGAGAGAGPVEQNRVAEQSYRVRLDLAAQLKQEEFDRIAKETDADKAAVETARAKFDFDKSVWQAEDEHETKLLELQKERDQRAREFSGGLFDALTAKGTAGSAIGPFLQQQFKGVEKTIFENATSGIFKQGGSALSGAIGGQVDEHGQPTLIGKLLRGTPLANGGAETADPIKANSTATADNTAATRDLSGVIRAVANGQAPTPVATSVPGLPGLPASLTAPGNKSLVPSSLNWLVQAGTMGALGATAGYTIGEMRRPEPVVIGNEAQRLAFRPPDTNRAFGIAGGLAGFGFGSLMHVLGLDSSGSSGKRGTNPDVVDNSSAVKQLTVAVQQNTGARSGGGGSGVIPSILGGSAVGQDASGMFLNSDGMWQAPITGVPSSVTDTTAAASAATALSTAVQKSPLLSALSGVGVGAGAFAATGADALWAAVSGSPNMPTGDGKAMAATASNRTGAILAGAGAVFTGVEGVMSGVKEGGGRGIASAVGSAAATAAALDPEPISKTVLSVLALGASVIKGIFGDPKAERANYENQALQNQQYLAPATINQTVDTHGMNVAYDSLGHPQSTAFQGYRTTDPQSVYFNGGYYGVPGQVYQPYQTPPALISGSTNVGPPALSAPPVSATPGTSITIHVNALDAQSIVARSADIGTAVYHELQKGGALGSQIQRAILQG